MPRYFFHPTNGSQTLNDVEGLDLPGEAAARDEARLFAHDLAAGKLMTDRDWSGWTVSIADEKGHGLDSVPIAKLDGE